MKSLGSLIGLILLVVANAIKIGALITFCSAYPHAPEIEELEHEELVEVKQNDTYKKELLLR